MPGAEDVGKCLIVYILSLIVLDCNKQSLGVIRDPGTQDGISTPTLLSASAQLNQRPVNIKRHIHLPRCYLFHSRSSRLRPRHDRRGERRNALSDFAWGTFHLLQRQRNISQPNITYNTRGYSCLSDEPCGLNYTITGAEHFNAAVNYSQIWYRQNSFPVVQDDDDDDASPEDRVGRLRFQTYNGLDCLQVGGEDDDGEVEAWYAWNCNNVNGTCETVPYDVKSFAIVPVEEDDQGDDDCYVAAEYASDGARSRVEGSLVALLAVFTVAAMFLQ